MMGRFVISLDFELFWGVRDVRTKISYHNNLLGAREILPRLLDLFEEYQIHATFATVGFLFAKNKKQINTYLPNRLPEYENNDLSPYNKHLSLIGNTEKEDIYHYAASLIDKIKIYPNQEIGTHTFSHYYCLENGQTVLDFEDDLQSAIKIAGSEHEVKLYSLIFPRNQFNESYLNICKRNGILAYRGNEAAWFYKAERKGSETLIKRAFRLLDAYFNISGHNCYSLAEIAKITPYNIPSSRFLRPYDKKLSWLNQLFLKRIKDSMTFAAKNNLVYHLWWHPHNFGKNQQENFQILNIILEHYQLLHQKYYFQSNNMKELAFEIQKKNE